MKGVNLTNLQNSVSAILSPRLDAKSSTHLVRLLGNTRNVDLNYIKNLKRSDLEIKLSPS